MIIFADGGLGAAGPGDLEPCGHNNQSVRRPAVALRLEGELHRRRGIIFYSRPAKNKLCPASIEAWLAPRRRGMIFISRAREKLCTEA